MHAASSVVLNAVKRMAGLPDPIHLLSPQVTASIIQMKGRMLNGKNPCLNLDETLIALAISAAGNPSAEVALNKLTELRDCEMHLSHIPTPGDENGLRRLGVRHTSDAQFASRDLFAGG